MNVFRDPSVPNIAGLLEYIADIKKCFCPYLAPAGCVGTVRYSVYHLDGDSLESLAAMLFAVGFVHTEILRAERRQASERQRPFFCENVFVRFDNEDAIDGERLFAWPHWLLKSRYTQVGVLFGKFWKGETATSRVGIPIPPTPYHMLSIRSKVARRNEQFFTKAPELLDTLISADDSGQTVLSDLGVTEMHVAAARVSRSAEEVIAISRGLIDAGIYTRFYDHERRKLHGRTSAAIR